MRDPEALPASNVHIIRKEDEVISGQSRVGSESRDARGARVSFVSGFCKRAGARHEEEEEEEEEGGLVGGRCLAGGGEGRRVAHGGVQVLHGTRAFSALGSSEAAGRARRSQAAIPRSGVPAQAGAQAHHGDHGPYEQSHRVAAIQRVHRRHPGQREREREQEPGERRAGSHVAPAMHVTDSRLLHVYFAPHFPR
ncbi:hypothetical protein AGIG_G10348 [Arapaima gigas]